MIFWIFIGLLALIVVITVGIGVRGQVKYYGRGWWGEISGAGAAWFSSVAVIGLCVVLVGVWFSPSGEWERQETYDLRALVTTTSNESQASGVFFLGFGYASSESGQVTTVAYIRTDEDGGSRIQRVDVDDAVIYEDATEHPYMEIWATVYKNNGVFVPWDYTEISYMKEYRFHIPEGTILQNYEVKP